MTDHDVGVMQQLLHFGERQRVDNLHARDGWRPFCAPANLQHYILRDFARCLSCKDALHQAVEGKRRANGRKKKRLFFRPLAFTPFPRIETMRSGGWDEGRSGKEGVST